MPLKTDYKNDVFTGNRKYIEVINPDGTKSFIDVTEYEELGDGYGAAEINQTNDTVNKIHVIAYPSPIKAGDDVAGNLLSWIEDNGQWEKAEFGQPYNGINIIKPGGIYTEAGAFTGEEGYRLYRQADGTFNTNVRSSENYIGYVLNQDTAIIGVLGGVDKEYVENMLEIASIPYLSGYIRLKSKKPADADGVMIRWKSTAWASGDDETTGTLIADITTDYTLGTNDWFTQSGYTNGTQYFIKYFPYKSSVHNTIIGENELVTVPQNGLFEYSLDNLSGSTIVDDCNSNNGTGSNTTYQEFAVLNGAVFNGSNARISIPSGMIPSVVSFSCIYKSSSSSFKKIFLSEGYESGGARRGYEFGINTSGNAYITTANNVQGTGLVKKSLSLGLALNTKYILGFVLDRSAQTLKVYVDGSLIGTITSIGTISTSSWTYHSIGFSIIDYYDYTGAMELDQIRGYTGDIGDAGFAEIYNGGGDL